MVILHDDEYYRNRIPEPDLGAIRNFWRFVWNPDKRQLLGRSGKEWALLGLFYLCFFAVLGSLFALQMWISIDYASKLERPFLLYGGLTSRSYFGGNFPLFRQLDFDSPVKATCKEVQGILNAEILYTLAKSGMKETTIIFSSKTSHDKLNKILEPRFVLTKTIPSTLKYHAIIPARNQLI